MVGDTTTALKLVPGDSGLVVSEPFSKGQFVLNLAKGSLRSQLFTQPHGDVKVGKKA